MADGLTQTRPSSFFSFLFNCFYYGLGAEPTAPMGTGPRDSVGANRSVGSAPTVLSGLDTHCGCHRKTSWQFRRYTRVESDPAVKPV